MPTAFQHLEDRAPAGFAPLDFSPLLSLTPVLGFEKCSAAFGAVLACHTLKDARSC